ncbi:MAG TPA: pyruvate formate-lyase-activating protein [Gammaproteobacteria bacterium]|nr:pyruvate formate-lyase-activating protein [Gammaproteobacteria bacterium]
MASAPSKSRKSRRPRKAAKSAKSRKPRKAAKSAKPSRAAKKPPKSARSARSGKRAKPAKKASAAKSAKPSKSAKPAAPPIEVKKHKPQPLPLSLTAKSPFEMRVHLGDGVPETDVQSALDSGDMGFLHSFTTGSTVDGPGVRVVAWTTGCGWRCRYCHNPDTWTMRNGYPITVAKAAEELDKYKHGLKVMSGGFTVSGGEPLMQDRFVVKLLTAAKKMGVHTTIESNGFFGERLTDADLEQVDLVMLGIKTWGNERHKELTGRDMEPTLAFARRLAARKRKMWVRFVLVPNLTDDLDDIGQIAEFAAGLGNVERVEVLPFHQMGRYKWHELGIRYHLEKTEPPTTESVDRALQVFRAAGLEAY